MSFLNRSFKLSLPIHPTHLLAQVVNLKEAAKRIHDDAVAAGDGIDVAIIQLTALKKAAVFVQQSTEAILEDK